jgi:hypothetical protein
MDYLSPQEFKEKILKLESTEIVSKMTDESIKMEAVRLCSILPELFGDNLDRKTLWERIGNGLISSCTKANYDIAYFVNMLLEYICSDAGKVATNEKILNFIEVNSKKSEEWRNAFFHYINTRYFLVIALARQEWEKIKALKKVEGKTEKKLEDIK